MVIVDLLIFIVGYWCIGIILLYELLVVDDCYIGFIGYECFVLYYFLLIEWFVLYVEFLVLKYWVMDNMDLSLYYL